jgi:hypothetical protein
MMWVGSGSNLWRVRVDLLAVDESGHRVGAVWKSVRSRLTSDGADDRPGDVGVDQGTGAAQQPVVGMLFWVQADDVGSAASLAVETAIRAGAPHGVGPALYDVTVIPHGSVTHPGEPNDPAMPD